MRTYLKGECPSCGCRLLFKEPAQADGAVVYEGGDVVKHGATVTRCDGCGEHVDVERPSKPKPKPKPAAKGKRRPQRSKRERARARAR